MIEIVNERLAGIEVLVSTPRNTSEKSLPTVLFYHGFTSSRLVYSYVAVALAQAGLRCVMPDLPDHGARFDGDENRRMGCFWSILAQAIDEFPQLQSAITERGWCSPERLAVGGASLGGMTALGILARYPSVPLGGSLMGSASYAGRITSLFPPAQDWHGDNAIQRLLDQSLMVQPHKLAGRPLLLWHGLADDVVPAEDSLNLAQTLHESGQGTQLNLVTEPGVRHRITPQALSSACDFFAAGLTMRP
ncbi:esterase [Salmonella enterica subsp. enterica serovar Choleraesuis]|nr:esterase [Salmonella enterica subsp. enterica serovar Choleraesuis]